MIINLPGFESYSIPTWDGTVEVSELKLWQYKRITGANSELSLYRKLIKVFDGEHTPIKLPKGLATSDLDFSHFTQIIVGVVACHDRSVKETIVCPECKSKNPLVLDLIKLTTVTPPKVLAPNTIIEHEGTSLVCNRLTIGKYIELRTYIDTYFACALEEVKLKASKDYANLGTYTDQMDIDDLIAQLESIGMVAICVDKGEDTFVQLVNWLAVLSGSAGADLYDALDNAITDLSGRMVCRYTGKCLVCESDIQQEVSPLGYFFNSRQLH